MRHDPPPLSQDLLAWFDRHKRDLPWRRTRDAYPIWLSEVMLQQTRVETVIPYYERFLARFPAVEDLAAAPLDEVLALWSGLGYYRRARQLHAAACRMAAAGGPPGTLEGWMELPGIGAYTAAAVASIAYGIAAPVLDGNVERVMARWLGLAGDVKRAAARARLRAAAAEFLVAGRSGDSNQALMELGAVICLPRRPKCLLCPLQGACVAAAEGQPEAYPAPRPRRSREVVRLVVVVAEHAGRVLLFQRPAESAVLAGTWELPWVEEEDQVRSAGVRLAAKYGVAGAAAEWRLGPELARVRHGITFRDFEVSVHHARLDGDTVTEAGGESRCGWFDPAEVRGLPTSSLVGKVLRAVAAAAAGGAQGFRNRGRPASRLPSRRRG